MQSQPIPIRRGTFQGDSLSPLLFCTIHVPLTNELNRADCGYQVHGTERKLSHLLCMDDFELLGRNENDLKNEIKIVQTISKDINMNFGLEKCARICLQRGRVQSKMHIGSTFENDIKELDPRKAYKYLGIEENFDIQHKNEKEKLKKEYLRRMRLVLCTELSAKNKIQATGSLAVPVLRYSFGIVDCHQQELQKLDRKTRKLLTIYGQHHPKADVDRLYVPRKQGGKGLKQLEAAHAVEMTKLAEYVDKKEDPLIQVVRTNQHNSLSAVLETARCLKTEVQRETRKMKDSIAEKTKERWHGKRMHGQLPRNLDEKLVDIKHSYR